MNIKLLITSLFMGAALAAGAATNDVTSMLQRGLFEEEANHNLDAAIQAYQSVVTQIDQNRKLAATAIYRLGECYRKQGNTNEASAYYQRILREFSDQSVLASLSEQSLAALGKPLPTPAPPLLSRPARLEQKRLLEEEVKLVEQKLQDQQKRFQNGTADLESVRAIERELLELKRQVAALDLGVSGTASGEEGARLLSRAARLEQKRLLEEEIKLLQQQLDAQQKALSVGRDVQNSIWATQREILELKRQVAALDIGGPSGAEEGAASSESEDVARIQALVKNSPDLINAPQKNGETLLEAAAGKGKLAVATLLLENGADVNGLKHPGLTPLHFAAGNAHKAMVDLLLRKGANPNARTPAGITPLHLAALKGYEAVAKSLLAAGAEPNARTSGAENYGLEDLSYGISLSKAGFESPPSHVVEIGTLRVSTELTPLHFAASAGYDEIAQTLISNGANVNAVDGFGRTALSYAAQHNYAQTVKTLLAAKADPNRGELNLPLATAAYEGDTNIVEMLLKGGADPNRSSSFAGLGEVTPLCTAVVSHHPSVVEQLIRAKADPNGTDRSGWPLVSSAVSDPPTLKALLEGGADPNRPCPDKNRPSALWQAVSENKIESTELLLAHGANPNISDRSGNTPLHLAVAKNQSGTTELLLKSSADVNARNDNGQTPLWMASQQGNTDLARLLLENKADPNLQGEYGQTPLFVAAERGPADLVRLLLKNKANPNIQDFSGQTPLKAANSRVGHGPPGAPSWMPSREAPIAASIIELLRQHGAMEEVPHENAIEVHRPATGYSNAVFFRTTNEWNHFTLLEILGTQFGLLLGQGSPMLQGQAGPGGAFIPIGARNSPGSPLAFPDFAHAHVKRPTPDLKSWQDELLDVITILESGDCSKDVVLKWGDVLVIPELDHLVGATWQGLPANEVQNLAKCLSREVTIVIGGRSTKTVLGCLGVSGGGGNFWLKSGPGNSGLVLTSSDVSSVKVTRIDPGTGKQQEWTIDCSQNKPAPQFVSETAMSSRCRKSISFGF